MKFVRAIWKLLVGIKDALVLIVMLLFFAGLYGVLSARPPAVGEGVLELNLNGNVVEQPARAEWSDVAGGNRVGQYRLRDLVAALDQARDDSRVVGLVARVGAAPLGMAQVQELRNAVIAFRAKKKPAVAYAETFGEFGPGGGAYYLATAFDEIWLQPSGDIGLTGVILESPFARGTLDKLGLKPRMDHRYEYKNAMNFYTEKKYDPYHKEAMEKLMNSWFSQLFQPGRYSFPSGHATLSAAFATMMALLAWQLLRGGRRSVAVVVCGAFAVLVALSRVVLGVHFLTDVVAGVAVGIAVALASSRGLDLLRGYRSPEQR